jgi:hypothetical protein
MQIRKNIEYKYSLLTKKKSVRTIRRENREFYTHSWEIKRETLKFQEPIQDLRAYRWDKHLRAKDCQEIKQEEKKGGSWESSTGWRSKS